MVKRWYKNIACLILMMKGVTDVVVAAFEAIW
jgi:hypothetical protein